MAIRNTPHRSTTTRLFSVRCSPTTHQRLSAAAKEDGLTVGEELDKLLDRRDMR